MIFKYIIVDTGAILFGESTTHKQVAEGFDKVYSAGFAKIVGKEIKCYGESDSLKIRSIPTKDEQIIQDLFATMSLIKYFGFSVKEIYK